MGIKAGVLTTALLTNSGRIFLKMLDRITPATRFGPDFIRRVAVSNSSIVCITDSGKVLVSFILSSDLVPYRRAPIIETDAFGMAIVSQAGGVHFVDVVMGSEHCILLAVTSRATLMKHTAITPSH